MNKEVLLISETLEPQTPKIIGTNSQSNRCVIEVVLQDADTVNRNSRVYSRSVLENALKSEYVQERLSSKTWYGEAGHPFKPDVQRQLHYDQTRLSHIVTKVWWEGNKLMGHVEAAATQCGSDFEGLIRQGSKVAFSLRAVGNTAEKRGNVTYVKDPLTMFCFDWVVHPSHKVAYMQKIVSESDSMFQKVKVDSNLLAESGIQLNTGSSYNYTPNRQKFNNMNNNIHDRMNSFLRGI